MTCLRPFTERPNPVRSLLRKFTRARVTTGLDVAALLAITGGAALIFIPAGLIVLGFGIAGLSYLAAE